MGLKALWFPCAARSVLSHAAGSVPSRITAALPMGYGWSSCSLPPARVAFCGLQLQLDSENTECLLRDAS